MGVSVNLLKFLFMAHLELGVELGNCLTIGRQEVFFDKRRYDAVKKRFRAGRDFDIPSVEFREYADEILLRFGGAKISSMDMSDYEGANLIHDLNEPVGVQWHGRFDSILDFGSIEHIFQTGVVLQNYAALVKQGGVILVATEADGSCGHGLYQFSPELFYRFYSAEAGFRTHCFLCPRDTSTRRWIYVPDPLLAGQRIELPALGKMHLLIVSIKEADCRSQPAIQQSDYTAVWSRQEPKKTAIRRLQLAFQYTGLLYIIKSNIIDTFLGREFFRLMKLKMLPVKAFYPWRTKELGLRWGRGVDSSVP